jgi:hypothetical protein
VELILYLRKGDGKVIPLQALTGPESSRRLRFPDFNSRHMKVAVSTVNMRHPHRLLLPMYLTCVWSGVSITYKYCFAIITTVNKVKEFF